MEQATRGGGALAGTVWDEVLDTEHPVVIRTYIERWPRKDRAAEKVLVIVVEPDEESGHLCPQRGRRGTPAEHDLKRWQVRSRQLPGPDSQRRATTSLRTRRSTMP
jgi:hypothetical protein